MSIKKPDCGCGNTQIEPVKSPSQTARFAQAIFQNPLEPTLTGHTLPFATGGVFQLPKHITKETQGYEPTPKPSSSLFLSAPPANILSTHRLRDWEDLHLPGIGGPQEVMNTWLIRYPPDSRDFIQVQTGEKKEALDEKDVVGPGDELSGCETWKCTFQLFKDPRVGTVPTDKALEDALDYFAQRQLELMKQGDSIENHLPDWNEFKPVTEEPFYMKVIGARRLAFPFCQIIFTVSLVGVESEVVFLAGEPINHKGGLGSGTSTGATESILDSLRPKNAQCKENFRQTLYTLTKQNETDADFIKRCEKEAASLRTRGSEDIFIELDPSHPNHIMIVQLDCYGNCPSNNATQASRTCKPRGKKGTVYGRAYALAWCGCFDDPSLEGLPNFPPIAWMGGAYQIPDDLSDFDREALAGDNPQCQVLRIRAQRGYSPPGHMGPPVMRPAKYQREFLPTGN